MNVLVEIIAKFGVFWQFTYVSWNTQNTIYGVHGIHTMVYGMVGSAELLKGTIICGPTTATCYSSACLVAIG